MSAADRHVPAEVVDRVSNAIRTADGAHTMGAGALAEVAVAAMMERPPLLGSIGELSRRPLQTEALDLLALTADYPVEHPLRQAAARLSTRLALAEGKIERATAELTDIPGSHMIRTRIRRALEILKR